MTARTIQQGVPMNGLSAANDDQLDKAARRYALFTTDGATRFRMRLTDQGISPGFDSISFEREGSWTSRPYAEIRSVWLSSNGVGRYGVAGQCVIEFRNGDRLVVSSADARGLPAAVQKPGYRDFIRDLHERLVASGVSRGISFRSGYSEARRTILIVAMVAAVALFIALPLVLFLATGAWQMLGAIAFGVLLLWPAFQVVGPNSPRIYHPASPPDLLA